jgi:hypothetical protein
MAGEPPLNVSPALAGVLAARRELFNAHFRRNGRGVEPAAFAAFLRRMVDPLVAAAPEAIAGELGQALFELGLPAIRRGVWGGMQATELERAHAAWLPRLAAHVARDPRGVVAALGNASERLARELGVERAVAWGEALCAVSDVCPDLYGAGLVLAWRHGLAEAREAALARAAEMPPELCERLLGSARVDASPARRFVAPGQDGPLGDLEVMARVGGFSGFGGVFPRPPEVHACDGRLYATDGDVVSEVFADAFGARLSRAGIEPLELLERAAAPEIAVDDVGNVRWGAIERWLPALAGAARAAAVPGMAAVALEDSHFVFVLGRRAR